MARVSRDLLIRVDRETQAWEKFCPRKTFSGFTVVQVKDLTERLRALRAEVAALENNLKGAQKRRALCETEIAEIERRVVLAVRADDEFGEDSDLYGEMGFVPRSQRVRRPRRRVGGNGVSAASPATPPAPEAPTPKVPVTPTS